MDKASQRPELAPLISPSQDSGLPGTDGCVESGWKHVPTSTPSLTAQYILVLAFIEYGGVGEVRPFQMSQVDPHHSKERQSKEDNMVPLDEKSDLLLFRVLV